MIGLALVWSSFSYTLCCSRRYGRRLDAPTWLYFWGIWVDSFAVVYLVCRACDAAGRVAISSHPRRRNPDTGCSCLQLTEQVRWTTGQLVRVVVAVNPLHVCGQYRINQPVVVGG